MGKIWKIIGVVFCFMMLVACGKITEKMCEHEYEVISTTNSTCKEAGKTVSKCSKCGKEDVVLLPTLPHKIEEEIVEATCQSLKKIISTCKDCDYMKVEEVGNYGPHIFTEWKVISDRTETSHGLKGRECTVCDYKEMSIISNKEYLNTDSLLVSIESSEIYYINSYDELLKYFDACIIQRADKFKCYLMYEFGTVEEILNSLLEDTPIQFSYHVNASLQNNYLTLKFDHAEEASLITETTKYVQYDSVNMMLFKSSRDETFVRPNWNNGIIQFSVTTTDQLYFCIENGIIPTFENEDSTAFKVYNKMKEVLRKIVDDTMRDVDKVRAIYEYLVYNVIYDDELLQMLYQNKPNLEKYRGYYLEGVFLDKKAVCEGISKAFSALCNMEDIPCVVIEGYQTQNPNGAMHAWNKVYVEGNWYIVDATTGGTIINNEYEVLTYKYFLVDEESYSKRYTGINFTEIECNNRYDTYGLLTYQDVSGTKDMKISSFNELVNVVEYFNCFLNKNLTIEFEICYNVGESCLDEIKEAYSACGIYGNILYIEDGNIFMLMK